jgi:biopolymer transport protein ExbB
MNLIELFIQGGIVMYPLLAASILTIVLIIERTLFWFRVIKRQEPVIKKVLTLYREDPEQAKQRLELDIDLPIARIYWSAISLEKPTVEEFRLALEGAIQGEIPILKRFQNLLDTIITLSPLLGLLGTVTGLMNSFANIRIGEITGERATAVSGGISEALITTATGLTIAITAAIFANIFRGLYQQQISFIQEYTTQLELYFRRYHAPN